MSLAYITRAEAKAYCRIQHTALDDTIDLLIGGASAAVKNHLGNFSPYQGLRNDDDDLVLDSNYEPEIAPDSNGDQVVKDEVKLAVLFLVNRWIKYGHETTATTPGFLPPEVESILCPLRDPVLR